MDITRFAKITLITSTAGIATWGGGGALTPTNSLSNSVFTAEVDNQFDRYSLKEDGTPLNTTGNAAIESERTDADSKGRLVFSAEDISAGDTKLYNLLNDGTDLTPLAITSTNEYLELSF